MSQFKSHVSESESLFSQCEVLIATCERQVHVIYFWTVRLCTLSITLTVYVQCYSACSFDSWGQPYSFDFIFLLSQKQFFDVVPISATGFLPPESNATTTPTTTTPGISSGAASTTSPLNTGDVGGGKSGQQVCTDFESLNIMIKMNINLKN